MCLICSSINSKIKETLNDDSALFCLFGPSVNSPQNQNNAFSESSKMFFQNLFSRENAIFYTLSIPPPTSSANISQREKFFSIFVCEGGYINYHSKLYGIWSEHSGWHFPIFHVPLPTYSLQQGWVDQGEIFKGCYNVYFLQWRVDHSWRPFTEENVCKLCVLKIIRVNNYCILTALF